MDLSFLLRMRNSKNPQERVEYVKFEKKFGRLFRIWYDKTLDVKYKNAMMSCYNNIKDYEIYQDQTVDINEEFKF